ncbi:MAG: agmatinase [Ignavibacteria bacterium]|nr:agmatinase [Ignavibacteria bacterium]
MKILGPKQNFLALGEEHSDLDTAGIVVVSAPYEHTVSYGRGTARGPRAILDASAFVEFYDDETERELCFDVGIATLEPITFGKKVDAKALGLIERQIDDIFEMDKFVVTLGGEHTISAAAIASHYRRFPKMSVLQFDAHSDMRQTYEGSPYSHACVMARVSDFFPTKRITQVGIRAQCIEEAQFIRDKSVNTFYAGAMRRNVYGEKWTDAVVGTLAKDVYITFDVDALDPSVMPATGTPEPGGLLYHEATGLIRAIVQSGRRIVGFDVVELAPIKGLHHPNITAARLVYKILNLAFTVKRGTRK